MKKTLLGSMLVASMFVSAAHATKGGGGHGYVKGPKMITGSGCAISRKPVEKQITLVGNKHKFHKKGHVIKAGTELTRVVKFYYDFSDIVDCGGKHVQVMLTSRNVRADGIKFLNVDITGGGVINLGGGKSGHMVAKVHYRVKNPKAWKLTSEFHYKHVFDMKVSTGW